MTTMHTLKNHRWVRRVVWAVLGLLLLWALAWLAVPPLAKHLIQTKASEQLGRAVTLGAVDFKPWTLEVTLTDLSVAGVAADSSPQLSVKRVYIDVELQSLLRLAPVVDAVQLEAPVLRLTHRGDGRYDIDDVLAKLATPPDAPDTPPSDPVRFALYNLALQGGSVDFTDDTVTTTHQLRDLTLTLPFLSNLDSQRDVKVAPRVAFVLNGSRFDTAAEATPFAQTRKTDATLQLSGFDLAPYLGYLPKSLPVALQAGVVDANIQVAFQQTPALAVKLTGSLGLSGVRVAQAGGEQAQELLAFDALKLTLADVQPLAQVVKLSRVELTAPRLVAQRDAAGRLNLALASSQTATEKRAESPVSTKAGGIKDVKKAAQAASGAVSGASAAQGKAPAAGGAWQVSVAEFQLRDGAVRWRDQTTQPAAQLGLRGLTLDVTEIAWPLLKPLSFKGAVELAAPATAERAQTTTPVKGARPVLQKAAPTANAKRQAPTPTATETTTASQGQVTFSGTATEAQANVLVTASAVPLSLAAPYTAAVLRPQLKGQLDAELGLQWQPAGLNINASRVALSDVELADGPGQPLAALRQVVLTDTAVDLARQDVRIGKLQLSRPQASVSREADGRWMYERWLISSTPAKPSTAPTPAAKPWTVALGDLSLSDGALAFRDSSRPQPVAFALSALAVQLKNFGIGQPPGRAKPSPLVVSGRIAAGGNEPGRFSYNGNLALSPLAAQGQVDVARLPLHAFEPYFGDVLNIELLRADASFKGRVRYSDVPAGPTVLVAGDAAVESLRAVGAAAAAAAPASAAGTGVAADEDILSWKSLSLRGLDVALAPGAAPTVQLAESTLSDYFARIVVSESGRINLQNLTKAASNASTEAADAPKTGAASPDSTRAEGQNDLKTTEKIAVNAVDKPADPLAPVIRIGPVNLLNGQVYFSDRFVKPNYSANLTELSGQLSAFSSVPPASGDGLADLKLSGRAEGTASLEVTGKLNPLVQPLALDITGKVRDLELPPLSPYAIKYAGYGVERGKLSLDVTYTVLPSGQLTASNKFVLNQLRFGEKVEGAPNSLPVKLAVALLADRNGVIDINLPISGSLNDPQFSIGPIIFKAIINLIVKAVTSPFTLLASAVGGSAEELGSVAFQPGSALLGSTARQRLDKVAKALAERPALTMTVVGTASLAAERDALKRDLLQQRVLTEKRRTATRVGDAQPLVVGAAEYPALLAEVYKRTDMTKPRNVVGLAKELPVAEMEALLLANTAVSDEQVRALATQRATAVRDYLVTQKLPVDRLFLGASKTGPTDAAWRPRAELNLALP